MRAWSSVKLVTTFHPARPPVMWSSEPNWRAMVKGSLKLVLAVATSPIRSVTAAMAPSTVTGSKRAARAVRASSSGGSGHTAKRSPRKTTSSLPRSAVRAISRYRSRLWTSSLRLSGSRQAAWWWPAGHRKAAQTAGPRRAVTAPAPAPAGGPGSA